MEDQPTTRFRHAPRRLHPELSEKFEAGPILQLVTPRPKQLGKDPMKSYVPTDGLSCTTMYLGDPSLPFMGEVNLAVRGKKTLFGMRPTRTMLARGNEPQRPAVVYIFVSDDEDKHVYIFYLRSNEGILVTTDVKMEEDIKHITKQEDLVELTMPPHD
jgi:hypothetical protein